MPSFDPMRSVDQPIDREFRQYMSSSLQQLGKQVSEGIKQVVTNRQLRQMGEELQATDPNTEFFPQEAVGIITRYPLAAQDKRGVTALSMLGSQHKAWATEKARNNPRMIAGTDYFFDPEKGTATKLPIERTRIVGNPKQGIQQVTTGGPDGTMVDELMPAQDPLPSKPITRAMPNGVVEQYDEASKAWKPISSPNNQPKPLTSSRLDPVTQVSKLRKDRSDLLKAKVDAMEKMDKQKKSSVTGLGALGGMATSEWNMISKDADNQIRLIDEQIRQIQAGASIPGIPNSAVNPEGLIPEQPTQRKRPRYNPATDAWE